MSQLFEELFKSNLTHIAPILACGTFALAIILERFQALFWVFPMRSPNRFFEKLYGLVMTDRLAESIAFCDQYRSKAIARVARAALLRAHQPEILIEDGIELAISEVSRQIQRRTPFLSTLANVATLLGLFGTIAGLIYSFEAVGNVNAQQKSAILAAGISTAMSATKLGLAVAIPSMIFFSILMNRTNRLISEIDESAVRIIDIIRQRHYAAESTSESSNKNQSEHSGENHEKSSSSAA